MRLRTTSTQRTYRYVRLTILGATLLLGVAVGVQTLVGGVLPSLSAGYYTAAGPMFVASLFVVAAAFLALSGRSVEQGLLDIAAVLALVVAVVPTTVSSPACASASSCVLPAVLPAVVNNGIAVAFVVLVGTVVAVVLAVVQGTFSRGVGVTAGVVVALTAGLAAWAGVAPASFLALAHNAAAVTFFLLIGAVAAIAAWRPQRSPRRFRGAYATVAGGILLALLGSGVVLIAAVVGVEVSAPVPWVLIGEVAALVFFVAFWAVQTVELWNDPDPRLRV